MFYDRYLSLCTAHGVAPTTVLSKLGISKSAYTGWKSGAEPANRTKKQIADYFGMTVSELMSGGTIKAPTQEGERSDDPDIYRIQRARKEMTPAQRKKMMNVLKASFEEYFSDEFIDDDLDE